MGDNISDIIPKGELLNQVLSSVEFLNNYKEYMKIKDIGKLQGFLNNIDINKNYYHLSINKNKKYHKNQCSDTSFIKKINSLINKLTETNFETISNEINKLMKQNKHLLTLIIDTIIEKSILHPNYIDLYIKILKDINQGDIIYKYCDKYYNLFFNNDMDHTNGSKYIELCNINKRTDNIIGFTLLVTYLEKEEIITNYFHKVIHPFIHDLLINENELEIYRTLLSLDKIKDIYYKDIPDEYILILNELKNKTHSSKIKFKIMDILDQ
jgi:hypothetical protein